ncbi:MAG: hypothetical protein M0Z54_01725 [Thermaerobacter sp.]|nr:hypothetical protein [Thermaerobacter sp.]
MERSLVRGLVLGAAGLLAVETVAVLAAWRMGPVPVAVAAPGPGAARGWVPVVAGAAAGNVRGTVMDVIRTTPLTVDGIAFRLPPGVARRVAAGADARVEAAVVRQLQASSRGRALPPAVLRAVNAWVGHSAVWLSLGWGHLWLPVRVQLVRPPRH